MIKLDKQTVKKMADLAMLELSDAEVDKYEKELEKILGYVEKIKEVDTESIQYQSHVDIKNVLREDVAVEGLDQKTAVEQTKNEKGYIVVPNVI
jgi:aspartyl-tRNA(Asn)/glutamyl-tRNA(Gln) amidotransferase subunit C